MHFDDAVVSVRCKCSYAPIPNRLPAGHLKLGTRTLDRGATTFSKLGVQFLGLGCCTEQNTDGIPNFVHCYVKSWGRPSNFGGWGPDPLPTPPSGCALGRGHECLKNDARTSTGRDHGPWTRISRNDTRVHGPRWSPVYSSVHTTRDHGPWTRCHFFGHVDTVREHGP